jgi:hypothetical protein
MRLARRQHTRIAGKGPSASSRKHHRFVDGQRIRRLEQFINRIFTFSKVRVYVDSHQSFLLSHQ